MKDGREEPGLHVAFSPDGIRWTKHPKGPLLPTLYGGRAVQPPFADESPYKETPVKGKPPRKTWSYPLTMSDVIDVFCDPVRQVFVIIGKFWIDGPDGGAAWKQRHRPDREQGLHQLVEAAAHPGPGRRRRPGRSSSTAPRRSSTRAAISP